MRHDNSLSRLPLLLRKEPFGGLVFDPRDGTLVELDHEAFKVVKEAFLEGRKPKNSEESGLLDRVRAQLPPLDGRSVRLVLPEKEMSPLPDFHLFGAPTLLDFQITNRCLMGCPHCYASSTPRGGHARYEDMELAAERAEAAGVCQVAVGGGEPLLHPRLGDFLALCHRKGMVPNLSTNGMHLDRKNLALLKKYCGAVALSLEGVGERFGHWRKSGFRGLTRSLEKLRKAGVPTVLQATLCEANFAELDAITDFCLDQPGLYGVIFLAYKPVGRGETSFSPLSVLDPEQVAQGLARAFVRLHKKMRVGYDCCMTPAVASADEILDYAGEKHLEGCSAMRGSVGLTPDLNVIPCTFLTGDIMGNLREQSLEEIWQGAPARAFRRRIAKRAQEKQICRGCPKQALCLGGCPAMDLTACAGAAREA